MTRPFKPGDRVKLRGHSSNGARVEGRKATLVELYDPVDRVWNVNIDDGHETRVTESQLRRLKRRKLREWELRECYAGSISIVDGPSIDPGEVVLVREVRRKRK